MTKITQIYDALSTIITTNFPASTYTYLKNPYIPEDNDELTLKRGVGFYIGSGSNTNRQLSCQLSIERQVSVTQTIKFYGTNLDSVLKGDAAKTLFEDQFTLIKYFENAPLESSNGIDKLVYVNDNGIEFVFGNGNEESENFLMIRSTFSLEYLENLGV